jgi:hypothetical protein
LHALRATINAVGTERDGAANLSEEKQQNKIGKRGQQ